MKMTEKMRKESDAFVSGFNQGLKEGREEVVNAVEEIYRKPTKIDERRMTLVMFEWKALKEKWGIKAHEKPTYQHNK